MGALRRYAKCAEQMLEMRGFMRLAWDLIGVQLPDRLWNARKKGVETGRGLGLS